MGWTSKPPSGTPLKTGTWHTQNLVAFWSFQEGSGTTLNDIYGGKNATLYNFAEPPTGSSGWNTESWGPVLAFDGSDDQCYTNTNFAVADPVSIAIWIKFNINNATMVLLMNKVAWSDNYGFQLARESSNKLCARGSGSAAVLTSNTFSSGVWYHLVFIFNSSNCKIYVNNVQEASGTVTPINANNQTTLAIGRYHTSYGYFHNGRIDDIRVWNRALSTDEIAELYNDRWGIFQDPIFSIKSVAGVPVANIKSVSGVNVDNIRTIR